MQTRSTKDRVAVSLGFWILAGGMSLVALIFVLVPLWRSRGAGGRSTVITAIGLALAMPALALVLYGALGTSGGRDADDLPSVEEMVGSLEARLAAEPRDLEGWLMLGRSYLVMQRFADAAAAYGQAYELTAGEDADVVTSYAEALVLSDADALEGRAGALFTAALALAPSNPKALWYGGLSAYARGELETARERWSRLRDLAPPAAVDELLAERLGELDRRLAGTPGTASSPPASAASPPAQTEGPRPAAAGIEVSISLDPALAARVEPNAPLFVIARAVNGRGPPVAVQRRLAADLPLSVRLTDADAMLPDRKLSDFAELELVARIALSGEALPASGDLFGEADYRSGQPQPIELTVDRMVP